MKICELKDIFQELCDDGYGDYDADVSLNGRETGLTTETIDLLEKVVAIE